MAKPNIYKVNGGDGGCYGPNFGPVNAQEIAEVASDGTSYLLLKLEAPIKHEQDVIDYIVVSPRYVGDSLDKLRQRGCHVGVSRVLPNQEKAVRTAGVSEATVEYWAIGVCTPIE